MLFLLILGLLLSVFTRLRFFLCCYHLLFDPGSQFFKHLILQPFFFFFGLLLHFGDEASKNLFPLGRLACFQIFGGKWTAHLEAFARENQNLEHLLMCLLVTLKFFDLDACLPVKDIELPGRKQRIFVEDDVLNPCLRLAALTLMGRK